MSRKVNFILDCDSYKLSHWLQYPPETEFVTSYIEARGGKVETGISYPEVERGNVLFFGLQAFIKEYFVGKVFDRPDVLEAKEFADAHGEPFNLDGWLELLKDYDGYLPIKIQAIPEGTVVKTGVPLVQIRNTDKKYFWLTSYVETALLRGIWYPTTVATLSYEVLKLLKRYWKLTSDAPIESILFKLHDFAGRGVSSEESAALGGMAHLVNFRGSDTISGILAAKRYYHEPMAGFSIPAAEHSTITTWGKDSEVDAYRNMLKKFAKPGSLVAVVSDSYDIMNAVDNIWGGRLKDEVLASGATVIVRPDSGDPVKMDIAILESLSKSYGYSLNSKGFKVLPSCIRVIQGDGCTPITISRILFAMKEAGFSIDNIAFGMGGGLLQQVNRDTLRFAMKTNEVIINGKTFDVFKDPTDKSKASKAGRVAVDSSTKEYVREDQISKDKNLMRIVFEDGGLLFDENFTTIRERSQA